MSWLFWYTVVSAALAAVILKGLDILFSGVTGGAMLVLKPFVVAATGAAVFGRGGLRKVTDAARLGRSRNEKVRNEVEALTRGKGR